MPEEYLPDGFDATNENPYRKKKLEEEGIEGIYSGLL